MQAEQREKMTAGIGINNSSLRKKSKEETRMNKDVQNELCQ